MPLEIRNAIIEGVSITGSEHGVLTIYLQLDYGGVHQSFGGHVLYLPKSCKNHELKSYAGHFMWRVMEIAGVSEWEKIPGKAIRVEADNYYIRAIGHIVKEDWFCLEEDIKNLN